MRRFPSSGRAAALATDMRALGVFGDEAGNGPGRDGMGVLVPMAVVIEFKTAMACVPFVTKDRMQVEKRDAVSLRQVGTHLVQRQGLALLVGVKSAAYAVDRQQQAGAVVLRHRLHAGE